MTDAAIGYGSKYELETSAGSGSYVEIAEVYNLSPPNEKADVIDATNFQSPTGYKEFILGMTDAGEVKFDMNFLPGSTSETLILAAKASRQAYAAKITFPGGQVWEFSNLITDYAPAVPVADKMTCSVSAKVSGSVARL